MSPRVEGVVNTPKIGEKTDIEALSDVVQLVLPASHEETETWEQWEVGTPPALAKMIKSVARSDRTPVRENSKVVEW